MHYKAGHLEEAKCFLGVAHAERDVLCAEKILADVRLKETIIKAKLYRIQIARAKNRLANADLHVGRARFGLGQARRATMTASSSPCRIQKVSTCRPRTTVGKILSHSCFAAADHKIVTETHYAHIPGGGVLSVRLD